MRKERILIIDDDPDIRDVLDLSLSEYYTISEASNGKEGLEMVKTKNPESALYGYRRPGPGATQRKSAEQMPAKRAGKKSAKPH